MLGGLRTRRVYSIVGRKRLIQDITEPDAGDARASAELTATDCHANDALASNSCTLRRVKRGPLDSGDSALHRSAGSSTELAALDSPDLPSPLSVSGKEAGSLAAARPPAGGASVTEVVQATTRALHAALGPGACVLPSSQQSSATGVPDEPRAVGPASEPRAQQASSRSRFAPNSTDAAHSRDDCGGEDGCPGGADDCSGGAAASDSGDRLSLREVAAFQHPSLPGSRGRRAHADIVCDVQFSPGGDLIATAGVGKQVSFAQCPAMCLTTPNVVPCCVAITEMNKKAHAASVLVSVRSASLCLAAELTVHSGGCRSACTAPAKRFRAWASGRAPYQRIACRRSSAPWLGARRWLASSRSATTTAASCRHASTTCVEPVMSTPVNS